ncbi:MAG TPA: phosphate ABC transporter permease PstA [Egibacteraceae bacterium]|nr:phosphate ABC transporter permease PstA [Egibacteraceae bacterium]
MAAITPPFTDARDAAASLRRQGTDVKGQTFRWFLVGALSLALLTLLALVWDMWAEGSNVLLARPVQFLTSGLNTNVEMAGVWQGIKGSLMLGLIVAIVSFPIGIGAAVYLEEYAGNTRFARIVEINIRNLAGVPSIVYGLLGLAIFVQALGGVTGGRTVIAGGLTLAALVLPIVIITSQEALRAVPAGIREGALALGATRWESIRHHVMPAATPGILTGTVLSLARALGEAAPLLVVGAVTGVFFAGASGFFEQIYAGRFTALPMVIFNWARQPGPEWLQLTGAASLILVALIVVMNGFAIFLRNRYERKW